MPKMKNRLLKVLKRPSQKRTVTWKKMQVMLKRQLRKRMSSQLKSRMSKKTLLRKNHQSKLMKVQPLKKVMKRWMSMLRRLKLLLQRQRLPKKAMNKSTLKRTSKTKNLNKRWSRVQKRPRSRQLRLLRTKKTTRLTKELQTNELDPMHKYALGKSEWPRVVVASPGAKLVKREHSTTLFD